MFVCVKYGIQVGSDAPKENFVNADCACAVLMDSLKARAVKEMLQSLQDRRLEEKKMIGGLARTLRTSTGQLKKKKDDLEKRKDETEPPDGAEPKEVLEEEVKKKDIQITKCEAEVKEREDLIQVITQHEEKIKSVEDVDLSDPADAASLNMYEFGSIKATSVLPLRCTVNLMGIPTVEEPVEGGEEGATKKGRGPTFPMLVELPKVERSDEVDEMLANTRPK